MKKERCMLFFDIDGTLITTDGKRTFPESAKRALREARERGHLVYINTGRVMANVDDFIREVGFDRQLPHQCEPLVPQSRYPSHASRALSKEPAWIPDLQIL